MGKAIGGYFELELRNGEHYHSAALRLNSARSCLEYILRTRRYTKVYIPCFTCNIVKQPFDLLNIACEFYHIDENLEPAILPQLEKGEAFLYTNYFGLKQDCVERLAARYGERLIVDNAQAFFAPTLPDVDTFYSPRKFLGVPDGGYLYTNRPLEKEFPQAVSYDRMSHLLKRLDLGAEAGYADFKQNDEALAENPIMRMSQLTDCLLKSIDYEGIKNVRRQNFSCLHEALGTTNRLTFSMDETAVPMVYPYWAENAQLKSELIENKIFVATYWPNVLEWCKEGDVEFAFAKEIAFLPIDQRYGADDMQRMIELILDNE